MEAIETAAVSSQNLVSVQAIGLFVCSFLLLSFAFFHAEVVVL